MYYRLNLKFKINSRSSVNSLLDEYLRTLLFPEPLYAVRIVVGELLTEKERTVLCRSYVRPLRETFSFKIPKTKEPNLSVVVVHFTNGFVNFMYLLISDNHRLSYRE